MPVRWRAVPTFAATGVAAAAGLVHLGLLIYIFSGRASYPLDLEWEEGGMLCHALRLLEGQPLYAEPSVEFISFLYTPLYPLLLAALGKLFGLSYTLGRVISMLSFFAVCAMTVDAARRQSERPLLGAGWGLAAVGLLCAAYPPTAAWYDLVRNDSLFLALSVAGLYLVVYRHASWRWLALAGVLLGLAFLTKQTATLVILFAGGALLLLDWRRLPVLVLSVGLVAGGGVLLANHLSHGWFWRYVFELHQGHDFYWKRAFGETPLILLRASPVAGAMLVVWPLALVIGWIRRRRLAPRDRAGLFWFGTALTGVAISCVGFGTQWAAENAFIPGLVLPGLFCGVAAADLVARIGGGRRRPLLAGGAALLLAGAVSTQLVLSLYDPKPHRPTERDREVARAFIARLERIGGPLLVPYHPWYPRLAGQRPHYHQMGINDVTRAGLRYPRGIRERIGQRHYAAIILDNPPAGRYDYALRSYRIAHYYRADEVPRIFTGYDVRPRYLLLPRDKSSGSGAGSKRGALLRPRWRRVP